MPHNFADMHEIDVRMGTFSLVNTRLSPADRFGHAATYHGPSDSMIVMGGYCGELNSTNDVFQFSFGMPYLVCLRVWRVRLGV